MECSHTRPARSFAPPLLSQNQHERRFRESFARKQASQTAAMPTEECIDGQDGQDNHDVNPFRVSSSSQADLNSEHFDQILFLDKDFEILVLTGQEIKPLPQLGHGTIFAIRWNHPLGLVKPSLISPAARDMMATWMSIHPANNPKWQEILGPGDPMFVEDNPASETPACPEVSEDTAISDTPPLPATAPASSKPNTDNKASLVIAEIIHHHIQECTTCSAALAAAIAAATAAAKSTIPFPVAVTGAQDDLIDGIIPRKYRSLAKAVLFPCFLLLCAEMLQWSCSITLSFLRSRAAFDADFAAHTIIMETQAEVQFVYGILFSVLAIFYLMAW